jgi:hypothetical protein
MMRAVKVFALVMGACLMGCLDSARDRELTGSEGDAARHGFNDALRGARLAQIDVGEMTDSLAVGRRLTFTLPGAGQTELVVQSVRQLMPGVTTFSGHLADDETSDFTLSIEAGKLVGSIHQGTQAWLVEPQATSKQHVIRTVERAVLPKDEPHMPQAVQRISVGANDTVQQELTWAANANGNVRVLFLVASDVANGNSHAANIVASFNNSLSLSAVSSNNFLTLAGVQQVNSNFDNESRETILNRMVGRVAPFDTIDASMAANAADVAFLVVSEDTGAVDVGAFGRVGGVARRFEQANPFALSTVSYALGDLTALHEIGHVFGGQHENGTGIARPVVAIDDTWMTIMGGYIECPFVGLPATCVRLNRWSNPDQTFNGIPLGVAGQRDMETHLESAMPTVSNWRAEPSTTATMTSPAPGSTLPGSSVTFSWTTGSGVSQYYLFIGNSLGGSDLYAASQGLATSGTVNGLPTDGRTIYVRLWSYVASGWQYNDYSYIASSVATPAAMTSPTPGSTLPGATVTFSWNTGTGVSQYYLYVGNSSGSGDLYAASLGGSTAATVSNLPTDGRTLYVRLWSYTNLGWLFRDYTYTAATSCHPLAGSHGQLWTQVSANSQYVYRDGWCSVGRGLPEQCWEGTYYYYQDVHSSSCSSGGSSGSCYDGDAWWWVTCNALVDCIYNCSGQCIQSSC